MSETNIVLFVLGVMLVAILLRITCQISKQLSRIEAQLKLAQSAQGQSVGAAPTQSDDSVSGSAFEEFLSEDPQRRALSKSEQFAEFRNWRKEKGMNWQGS